MTTVMRKLLPFFVFSFCCACSLIDQDPAFEDAGTEPVTKVSASGQDADYVRVTPPFKTEDVAGFLDTLALAPTHKAIRIVPSNMEQLHRMEQDTSLFVLYHPFDCEPAPEEDSYNASRNDDSVSSDFGLTEECKESCDEGEADDIIINPVYVFWPNSRPIPADVDYEFCYDATIPGRASIEERVSKKVEQGESSNLRANLGGRLMTKDNRLNQYVPLCNARLYYHVSSSVLQYTSTDASGYFVLVGADVNYSVSVSLINEKFAVRDSLTSNVISFSLGPLSNYMLSDNYAEIKLNVNFKRDVFKAASYYFYGSNALLNQVTRYDSTGKFLDINVIDNPGKYYGCFYNKSNPHIDIWNYCKSYYSSDPGASYIFGTVLHELGHATHYASLGSSHMSAADTLIKESFASFFGWYNVKEYYSSVITSHSDVNDICTQGRQAWQPGGGNYTPLYIDLYDNYNQHLDDSRYNDDQVSGVPVWVIKNLGLGPQDFQSVFKQAYSYVGTYFSSSDECFEFMAPYIYLLPSIHLTFN